MLNTNVAFDSILFSLVVMLIYKENFEISCVLPVGLEPTLLAKLDFESSVSANSTTRASVGEVSLGEPISMTRFCYNDYAASRNKDISLQIYWKFTLPYISPQVTSPTPAGAVHHDQVRLP